MIVVRGFEKPNLSSTVLLSQTVVPSVQTKKIQNYLIYLNEVLGRGNFSQVFRGINSLTSTPHC
jgi:hypothetical protein